MYRLGSLDSQKATHVSLETVAPGEVWRLAEDDDVQVKDLVAAMAEFVLRARL